MKWGKQVHYCPNCGSKMYDSNLTTNHVMSINCSDECRKEYEMKYTRMFLGKDADEYPK